MKNNKTIKKIADNLGEKKYFSLPINILPQSFYARDTVTVAQELLGNILVREIEGVTLAGIITETEAYQSDDAACHGFRGKTARTQALFGPVGCAYVYFTYGAHFCMNVVARSNAVCAGGVLIRAIEPIVGIEEMLKNRKKDTIKNLTNGPGKVAQALAIDRALYGVDVTKKGLLYIAEHIEHKKPFVVHATPRIGISKAQDKLWRFLIEMR